MYWFIIKGVAKDTGENMCKIRHLGRDSQLLHALVPYLPRTSHIQLSEALQSQFFWVFTEHHYKYIIDKTLVIGGPEFRLGLKGPNPNNTALGFPLHRPYPNIVASLLAHKRTLILNSSGGLEAVGQDTEMKTKCIFYTTTKDLKVDLISRKHTDLCSSWACV